MVRRLQCFGFVLLVMLCLVGQVRGEDFRRNFGTQRLETAQHINRLLRLWEQKKIGEAKAEALEALKIEPNCDFALYWLARIHLETGDVAAAIEGYEKVLNLDESRNAPFCTSVIPVDAAINLGLIYGKLGKHCKAAHYFSRAVLLDPEGRYGLKWKAFRNLAISHLQQDKTLAAAWCIVAAHKANPQRVGEQMVRDFCKNIRQTVTTRMLPLFNPPGETAEREPVEAIELERISCEDPIDIILADPCGKWMVGVPQGKKDRYYFLPLHDGIPGTLEKRKVSGPVLGATLSGRMLFLSVDNPPRILTLSVANGQVRDEIKLPFAPPTSFAVLQERLWLFYPNAEKTICFYNWEAGKGGETDLEGDFVTISSEGKVLFSLLRSQDKPKFEYLIIPFRGGPVHIMSLGSAGWKHARLYKGYITRPGVYLAEVREQVASNASVLTLSSNGKWVAPTGGGGWREAGQKGGYGTAVFDTGNLENVRGFYGEVSYPVCFAFNPVNGQVASVATEAVQVYAPQGGKAQVFHWLEADGEFVRGVAFSGDGQLLVVGTEKGGLRVFSTPLLPEEEARAKTWWQVTKEKPTPKPDLPEGEPIPWLADYEPSDDRREPAALLRKALKEGRPSNLPSYMFAPRYREYVEFVERSSALLMDQSVTPGVAMYRIKEEAEMLPDSAVKWLIIGQAKIRTPARDEGRQCLLKAIRSDAGRTRATLRAFWELSAAFQEDEMPIHALHCLAAALYVDRYSDETLAKLQPLLKELGMAEQENRVAALRKEVGGTDEPLHLLEIPPLIRASEAILEPLAADTIYERVVTSVVMIQVGASTGSGFFVANRKLVLTNSHVVEGAETVKITPFVVARTRIVGLRPVTARVLSVSEELDLALLQCDEEVATADPLPLRTSSLRAGERVYAIGSLGMGKEILTQTLTEGIVSATERKLEGHEFIQHTAAVNPGNSGGPLIDDRGRVVGVVTLKAQLENVSFAIPVNVIEEFYKRVSRSR